MLFLVAVVWSFLKVCGISSFEYATIKKKCFTFHGHLGGFQFGASATNATVTVTFMFPGIHVEGVSPWAFMEKSVCGFFQLCRVSSVFIHRELLWALYCVVLVCPMPESHLL